MNNIYEEESKSACPYGAIRYEDRKVACDGVLESKKVVVVDRQICCGCGCCPPGIKMYE